jgi:acetyltransferase-like isoleucine patch superfamily enzyme
MKKLKLRFPRFFLDSFPNFYIIYLRRKGVKIGYGTKFNGHVHVDDDPLVEIGANCILTHGVRIFCHDGVCSVLYHIYGNLPDIVPSMKTTIGDNVYIGSGTTVLKGVTIGKNSVIGAGSVVTRSIPANSVAVGNPCKVISTIEEYYAKNLKKFNASNEMKNY